MLVVRPELLAEVRQLAATSAEWPVYGSFVHVAGNFDVICIGRSERYWHVSLLEFIRDAIEGEQGTVFGFGNDDVSLGAIEWEHDGSVRVVGTSPAKLRDSIRRDILTLIEG